MRTDCVELALLLSIRPIICGGHNKPGNLPILTNKSSFHCTELESCAKHRAGWELTAIYRLGGGWWGFVESSHMLHKSFR